MDRHQVQHCFKHQLIEQALLPQLLAGPVYSLFFFVYVYFIDGDRFQCLGYPLPSLRVSTTVEIRDMACSMLISTGYFLLSSHTGIENENEEYPYIFFQWAPYRSNLHIHSITVLCYIVLCSMKKRF